MEHITIQPISSQAEYSNLLSELIGKPSPYEWYLLTPDHFYYIK